MKRTYQPNNRRRSARTASSSACGPARAVPSSRPAAARGAKDSRCEFGPGRPRDLLPGRPPPQTQGIRRVLRLRGARFRTTHPGLPPRRPRRPRAHAPGDLGSAPRGQSPCSAIACGGDCGRSSDAPRSLFGEAGCGSSSTPDRRRPRRPSRSSRRTSPRASARALSRLPRPMNGGARARRRGSLDFYKRFLSPLLPRACRFEPTCSVYAREAIAAARPRPRRLARRPPLLRCHPFHRGGLDPVP